MKLDILVPQYKETDEVIKPLFDSIALQQLVDFNNIQVIVVNDGTDVKLSEKLLNSYPFKIKYYENEHAGVSATRQKALELSEADYVMFCDADDMFFNMCGLWLIFNEMKRGFDTLITVFIEETRFKTFIKHEQDMTFVHGKVHRRQYLMDQNIKWNSKLTIHEDSFFETLCQKCSDNIRYNETPIYLWKFREDSICRKDPLYILKTFNNLIDSNSELIDELLKRNKEKDAQACVTQRMYDSYLAMNRYEWMNEDNQKYRKAAEKRLAEYYHKYGYLMRATPFDKKCEILKNLKSKDIIQGNLFESFTFETWLNKLDRIYSKNK